MITLTYTEIAAFGAAFVVTSFALAFVRGFVGAARGKR